MVSFIDEHRVEPIGTQLPIAPSTYCEYKAQEADPDRLPARARRDIELSGTIQRVWDDNFQVYGARKVWRRLNGKQFGCCVQRSLAISSGLAGHPYTDNRQKRLGLFFSQRVSTDISGISWIIRARR